MRKGLFLLLFGCVCGVLGAREVTVAEAQAVAIAWAARNTVFAGEVSQVQVPIAVRDADGVLLYYKVMLGERGMVVVAGDTNLDPVIAALPEVTSPDFPARHPLEALLRKDMTQRRALLVSSGIQPLSLLSDDVTEMIVRNHRRWGDLLGMDEGIQTFSLNSMGAPARIFSYPKPWSTRQLTHWNQTSSNAYVSFSGNELYNFYLPYFANGTQVKEAGCVAIAGAAILEFFQVPRGPENVQKTIKVNDSPRPETTTIGGVYDWSVLPTWTWNVELSNDAKNLLGVVPYDLGVLVEMNYKSTGSAAGENKLAEVLTTYYGFVNASSKYTSSASDFASYIYPQVRAGVPVFLSINDGGTGGHAVVAVGYGEDDDNNPYTRIFMGWGGAGDAWYALPSIRGGDFLEGAGNYTTISSVITGISLDEKMVALCGRVTNEEGLGVPYERVTVRYQAINAGGSSEEVLSTGLHGEYALRVPPATRYTLTVGEETKTVSNNFYPQAVDFEIAKEGVMPVYTDAQDALDRAIQEGKLLFILSGTDWDETCTDIKKYLASLGASFNEKFIFFYSDNDYGLGSMNLGAPAYAIFDPRTFILSRGVTGNSALAEGTSSSADAINRVLATQWERATIAKLEIQGLAATLERAEYTLRVTYGDGVSVTLPEVSWSVEGDATIDRNGTLVITGTEDVKIVATTVLHGEAQSAEFTVKKVNADEVVSLMVGCKDSLEDNIIDLETTPWPVFNCTAFLADGSMHEVVASSWRVSESVEKLLPEIGEDGKLNYAHRNALAKLGHTLTVTGTYGNRSASTDYTVYGYTSLWINAWEITPQPSVPGGFSKIKITSISYNVGDEVITTSNTSMGEYRLLEKGKSESEAIVFSSDTLELAIPLGGETMFVFLDARKKNGKNTNYSRTGEITIGVEPASIQGYFGDDKGHMPYAWLRPFFRWDEQITEAKAKAIVDEDYDCDGYANWEEYVLGTDPQDAESTLRLNLVVPPDGGQPTVSWNERPGRTYQLLGADTLEGQWGEVNERSRFFKVNVKIN